MIVTKNRTLINDVTLRDGHQSLLATRMTNQDILALAASTAASGYNVVQVWGGALPDAALQFLNENPFENLRRIRAAMPDARLGMLARGQNAVGYRNYADDMIEAYLEAAAEAGIDVFTIFDGLNFTKNQRSSMKTINNLKMRGYEVEAQGVICIARNPCQNLNNDIDCPDPWYYAEKARELIELGADSLYLKDMAGIATPAATQMIITAVRDVTDLPLTFHAHASMGRADASNIVALQNAVAIETANRALSGGTGHSSIQTLVDMINRGDNPLKEYVVGLDMGKIKAHIAHLNMDRINETTRILMGQRRNYDAHDTPYNPGVQQLVIKSEIPGGMLSNLKSQVEKMIVGTPFNFDQVYRATLQEVPHVTREFGYPPKVTPFSQIVGAQSVQNALSVLGDKPRYSILVSEAKDLLVGKYGPTPMPADKILVSKALERSGMIEVISGRPADALPPELPKFHQQLVDAGIEKPTSEQVLIHALSKAGLRYLRANNTQPVAAASLPTRFASHAANGHGKFIGDHLDVTAATLEALVQEALEITYIKTGFFQYLDQTELDAREAACKERMEELKKQVVADLLAAGVQPVQAEFMLRARSKAAHVNGNGNGNHQTIGGIISINDYIAHRARKLGVSADLVPVVGPEIVKIYMSDTPEEGREIVKLPSRRPQNPRYSLVTLETPASTGDSAPAAVL